MNAAAIFKCFPIEDNIPNVHKTFRSSTRTYVQFTSWVQEDPILFILWKIIISINADTILTQLHNQITISKFFNADIILMQLNNQSIISYFFKNFCYIMKYPANFVSHVDNTSWWISRNWSMQGSVGLRK